MKNYLIFLSVFVVGISVFRFIYLEDGLSIIINVCFPIIAGIIIASIFNPILVFIQNRLKIKNRYAAITFTFLFIIFIISIIITIITPNIILSIRQLMKDIPILFFKASKFLSDFGSENELLQNYLTEITNRFSYLMSWLLNFAFEKVINIFSAIANMLLSIIIAFYILVDKEKIENWTFRLSCTIFGKKTSVEMFRVMQSLYNNVSNYLAGKIISSIISGILMFIGSKYIIKSPYPVIDSIIIGATNIIPYFGTFIGGIPILLINVLYDSEKGFLMFIYILILQQIDNLVIDPKILSSKLSIKPIIIIIAIIIGGGFFGPIGLFLATPVAALAKTSIDAFMNYKLKGNSDNFSIK